MTKWQQIEGVLDSAAAAWMAVSVGIALALSAPQLGDNATLALILAGSAAAWLITYRLLAAMREAPLRLPSFDLAPLDEVEPGHGKDDNELQLTTDMAVACELLLTSEMMVLTSELLLTRGQMLNPPPAEEADLLLDDVLAQLQPNSRVVQLFDPQKLPTAGELQSRIERHLGNAARVAPDDGPPDASQALYDALADLRRSLA
jgi:hypothetical protein